MHYELYDPNHKKLRSETDKINFDLSEEGDILGLLASAPMGNNALKTLKIIFGKPESLGELSLSLENYAIEAKK